MAGSRKFRVVLIEEGLGNLRDRQYYTRQAIESGVELFNGSKCNADHPNALEEQIQPEGSIRKIVGHYENLACVSGDTGQAILEADLVLLDGAEFDWVAALLERDLSVTDKSGKQFVGLSINASGVSNPIALAEFLKTATIPESALAKLGLAETQGIEEIELCTLLTEADSCDIVTRAGARGRVKKLLETETLRMAAPAKKPAAKPATRTAREGDAPPKKPAAGADGGAGGDQPGHADADQDKELIASMLKKALGDGDHGEEAHEAMKQAHEKAIKCGYEGEAAQEAAVAHMKMSHETEESEGEETESEAEGETEAEEAAAGGDDEDPAADAGAQPSKGGKGKMEREIIALKAQNVKLMERFAQIDAVDLRTKALKESGFGGEALKALGGILRGKSTEKSINDAVKTFKEAYGVATKEPGFIVGAEKNGGSGDGMSFEDCVDNG